ncbi:MAG: TlpA family protein disulfide reductase [Actinomycetia bacterium]|nr:TlpA family protein disulfide reductase [Actinomycetes bacterium]
MTKVRIGTSVVAVLVAVGASWAASRSNDDSSGDTAHLDTRVTFEQPSIETNAAVEGDPLPDATVQNLAGDDIAVSSLVGQPMVINIWGSTCGPCKKELPGFAAAHLQYGDSVRFVGIDYLPASDREEAFARDKGVEYELLYDGDGEFINAAGVAAFPVTLFVDANGRILRQTGQLDEAELTAIIESDLL